MVRPERLRDADPGLLTGRHARGFSGTVRWVRGSGGAQPGGAHTESDDSAYADTDQGPWSDGDPNLVPTLIRSAWGATLCCA